MTIEARKAYLSAIRKRYRESGRGAKTRILDEFCKVCRYARKYAIRVLNRPARRPTRSRKRPDPPGRSRGKLQSSTNRADPKGLSMNNLYNYTVNGTMV